ncbi:hypothetical protein HanXRQr2_Chr14g0625051 [Helianthus annuus]|uniref:Uncharacterized protein n=1 Tax=Helianthus annuus TaxID=4232 RepID=A0A251TFN0_HELAN|nr:hypothetical protein HanXRQr2_Chr14g0625051 [Helianthus annuus]KAJ0838872.1 hypothetical protein HanPSC8_Chr14g0599831 [Helianthus annuus]
MHATSISSIYLSISMHIFTRSQILHSLSSITVHPLLSLSSSFCNFVLMNQVPFQAYFKCL